MRLRLGAHARKGLRRNIEIGVAPQPAVVGTGADVTPELAPDETERGIGAYRDAMRMPRVGIETRGQIDREQRSARCIRSRDRAGIWVDNGPRDAYAEDRVDDHVAVDRVRIERAAAPARSMEFLAGAPRVAGESIG